MSERVSISVQLGSLRSDASQEDPRPAAVPPPPPLQPDAMPLDARARQMFAYFSRYNYEVASRGEVITFVGNYRGSISE